MESGLPNTEEMSRDKLASVHTRLNSLADRLEMLSKWKPAVAAPPAVGPDLASSLYRIESKLDQISAPQAPARRTASLNDLHQRFSQQHLPQPQFSEDADFESEPDFARTSNDPVAEVDRILTKLNTSEPAPSAGWSGNLDDAIAQIS